METKSEKKFVSKRTEYILKAAKHFTPSQIAAALADEGFEPITRVRVDQILKDNNITPIVKRYNRRKK